MTIKLIQIENVLSSIKINNIDGKVYKEQKHRIDNRVTK